MAEQCDCAAWGGSSCEVNLAKPKLDIDSLLSLGYRLERLEWTISTLTQRVNVLEADRSRSESQQAGAAYGTPGDEDLQIRQIKEPSEPAGQTSAPLFILRDVTTDTEYQNQTTQNVEWSDGNLDTPPQASDDIIIKRLISPQEAFTLLSLFQTHYSRWVAFEQETPTAVLLEKVRKFPLLLTACCLIAVR